MSNRCSISARFRKDADAGVGLGSKIMIHQKIRLTIAMSVLAGLIFFSPIETPFLAPAFAQSNIRIFHTQEHEAQSDSYLGRDVWFAIPMNYSPTDRSTKYFNVYVNSPRNTTVNFQITGGPIVKKPVTAGKVAIFTSPTPKKPSSDIPLSTELYSSGVVEQKAIHVWSDDADIAVYFLSRRDYSSGGMYVLPPTGWGKEYVVGAYESIFDPTGQADWPSEFAVVSDQDNTTVTITPNWDLRKDGFPSVIEHQKNVPFTVNLNRGECVQYQTVLPVSDGECDVTGTIITSNNPVGVMGCAVDPYIYFPYGYGDYCLSMLQPVRTLSDKYFTAPFAGRKYGGDAYCAIATKAQTIFRNGVQVALLSKEGDHYFIYDDISASPPSLWTSDAPFELMQYVPSATFGTGNPLSNNRNLGDADMCSVNPADQFGKKVYFQTPTIDPASGQGEFINYVNILLPVGHEGQTTYDGTLLSGGVLPPNIAKKERFPVPNTAWEAIRLTYGKNAGEGSHTVLSDTGVGVYLYGYGSDDSYSWAGSLGTRNHADLDTVAPLAVTSGPCFCAHVQLSDAGPGQSKLSSFGVDSAYNMSFYPDPNFIPGSGVDNSFYDMCIIDSSSEAYLSVSTYDLAGNRTTVFSTYKPQFVKISPSPLNFGTVNVGNTAFKYDTICNTSENPFHFSAANLNLTNGKKSDAIGFTIDSAGADGDIAVGDCRVVKIKFVSLVPPTVKDTMILTDECTKTSVALIGNGGAADFDIHPYAFDCTPLKANRPSVSYFITNPSGIDIQIDSIWLDDNINFGYNVASPATNDYRNGAMIVPNSNTLSGQREIVVTFSPQSLGFIKTPIHVKAKGGTIKVDTVSGYGCAPNIVSIAGTGETDCGAPFSVKVPLTNTGTFFDSLVTVKGVSASPGFSAVQLQQSDGTSLSLPYHLDSGAASVIYATVNFTPAAKACGTFTDTIITIRQNGEIANKTEVTVKAGYREAAVTRDNVDFGTQPFGSAKVQNYFEVCNNVGCDSLIITSVSSLSIPGTSSFTLSNLYKIGATPVTLPVGLAHNECLDIYADFDPAKSNVANQADSFGVASNACNGPQTVHVLAAITTAPPPIQGFSDPAILSCDVNTDSVMLTNINAATTETITAITIVGADKTNFTSTIALPIVVAPGGKQKIPILFTPVPQAGLRNYSAWVKLAYTDGAGNSRVDSAAVAALGQGVDLTVASRFANPVAIPGDYISLPIQLSLDKHGLTTPLTTLSINRIELTYVFNQNILDVVGNDIKNAVKLNNTTWSIDMATSKIDPATSTLQLNLTGPALGDVDLAQPIGLITFRATLPKTGSATDVKLTASNFLNGPAQAIGNCMTIARKDSIFTLIFTCGDSTLQRFMNGQTIFSAYPVHPNPAGKSGGNVLSFQYASRTSGIVSLAIYDELGKEVAHVIRDENLPAGTFEVRYDSSPLSEGTYIYRFALNNIYITSGRFVIQK